MEGATGQVHKNHGAEGGDASKARHEAPTSGNDAEDDAQDVVQEDAQEAESDEAPEPPSALAWPECAEHRWGAKYIVFGHASVAGEYRRTCEARCGRPIYRRTTSSVDCYLLWTGTPRGHWILAAEVSSKSGNDHVLASSLQVALEALPEDLFGKWRLEARNRSRTAERNRGLIDVKILRC